MNIILFPSIASTQEVASMIAHDGPATTADYLIVSRKQRSGRGRGGGEWFSPPGGYYASLITRVPPVYQPGLPLKVGMSIAEFLMRTHPLEVLIRWPNDLMIRKRKVAGILIDLRGETAIIGFGINLSPSSKRLKSLSEPAGSLQQHGFHPVRFIAFHRRVVGDLIPRMKQSICRRLDTKMFSTFSYFKRGDGIRFRNGDRMLEGTYLGISRDGGLRVNLAGMERTMISAYSVRKIG